MHDEHAILWTASKCLDLRRFAPAHGQEEEDFKDIKEPLKHILQWMTKGGVPDVPHIDVVYGMFTDVVYELFTDVVYGIDLYSTKRMNS